MNVLFERGRTKSCQSALHPGAAEVLAPRAVGRMPTPCRSFQPDAKDLKTRRSALTVPTTDDPVELKVWESSHVGGVSQGGGS